MEGITGQIRHSLRRNKKVFLALLVFGLLFVVPLVFADFAPIDDFESYAPNTCLEEGIFNDYGEWYHTGTCDTYATSSSAHSGTLGLNMVDGNPYLYFGSVSSTEDLFTKYNQTDLTFTYYFDELESTVSTLGFYNGASLLCAVEGEAFGTDIFLYNGSTSVSAGTDNGGWNSVEITFDLLTSLCSLSVNGGTSATSTFGQTAITNIRKGGAGDIDFDDFELDVPTGYQTYNENVFFNYPRDYISPNPIPPFTDFQVGFSDFGTDNTYTVQVRSGISSSTIDVATSTCNDWPNCKEDELTQQFDATSGFMFIPNNYLTLYPLSSTSTYYWKVYLYDNDDGETELLTSSNISIGYTFSSTSTSDLYNSSNTWGGGGSVYYHDFSFGDATEGSLLREHLGNKLPFAYIYDIADIIGDFSDDGGSEFVSVAVSLPMVGTTTVVSKDVIDNVIDSGTASTIKNAWSAILYIALGFYLYGRVKSLVPS